MAKQKPNVAATPSKFFQLTPAEAKALTLYRTGNSPKEIAIILGWRPKRISAMLSIAVEKERALAMEQREKAK